jgi:UDP-glucose 4-epimerase
MKTCLVLGGSGFIGSHVVELLVAEGFQVRVFSLSASSSRRLASVADRVELRQGDFRNPESLADAVRGCDYVCHLAGTGAPASSNRDVISDVETNLVSTLRLLEICVREKVRQIIFCSSGGTVYGPSDGKPIPETHPTAPISSYGITKLAIEKYLELFRALYGLDYSILRVANAYGPRLPVEGQQGVVGVFLDSLRKAEPIVVWGDGLVMRDYVYVGDVARAFRAALGQRSPFRIFNIGTGTGTSLLELIGLMQQVTGDRVNVVHKPARQVDIPVNILDPSRARQYLGYEPCTSLETGLLKTWNWLVYEAKRHQLSAHIP